MQVLPFLRPAGGAPPVLGPLLLQVFQPVVDGFDLLLDHRDLLGKIVVLAHLPGQLLNFRIRDRLGNGGIFFALFGGGQAGGEAVADVLFGDYNPAGRLPVTFYASDADLPHFNDYDMEGHTYRYFKGQPLFPFGHGLSYTTFAYGDAQLDGATLKIPVANTGSMDGDEVVQLYISNDRKFRTPIRSLKGFDRISLKAGESMDVVFTVAPDELTVVDQKGVSVPMKGKVKVSVGGGQPGYASDCLMSEVVYRR